MKRGTARAVLVLVAGLWIATVYALSVGAVEPVTPEAALTHCVTPPVGPAVCQPGQSDPPPSPTRSPSPSPTGTRSPTPSRSPTSPSPRPTAPPGQSPSPSPSPSPTSSPTPTARRYDSRITIAYSDRKEIFKGRVTSENARCEGARSVVVKRVKPGKDRTVGRTQTSASGHWRIAERNPRGRYYAKVARKRFAGGNNTTIVCKPAKSKTIRP